MSLVNAAHAVEGFAPALKPGGDTSYMAVMITRRCNMTCGHCSVASGPGIKAEPAEEVVEGWMRQIIGAGMRSVQITGGEPMLRPELLLRLVKLCRRHGVAAALSSNGFWGRDAADALRLVRKYQKAGVRLLTISYDRFHAPFQEEQAVAHIADACGATGLPMSLNITRLRDDSELGGLVESAGRHPNVRVRFYDVQPVGRARHLDPTTLRNEAEGFCNAAGNPVITDDGRVMACNGPSYFAREGSPLHCGSLKDAPFSELLQRHRTDPILETIRLMGPSRLRRELEQIPDAAGFQFRESYHGLCDLCVHLNTSTTAVAALRERVTRPAFVAELAAARRVLEAKGARGGGVERINLRHGRRIFFRLATAGGPLDHADERILGRADLDWKEVGDYLGACALALPLSPVLEDPVLRRFAPVFFIENLQRRATAGSLKVLVVRDALRRIREVLASLGDRAFVLKGCVPLIHPAGGAHPKPPGDIDLLAETGRGPALHAALREAGFEESSTRHAGVPRGHHHLSPLSFRGIGVEVHTALAQSHTGVLDRLFLERPVQLDGPLWMLRPEAMFYHVAAHAMWHQCVTGLKSAWLADWILRNFPAFDPEDLLGLVRATPSSRAFWSPVTRWARVLGLAVPQEILAAQPRDGIQCRLDRIAGRHLFRSVGGSHEREPFLVPASVLLSCSNWRGVRLCAGPVMGRVAIEVWNRGLQSLYRRRESSGPIDWARRQIALMRTSYDAFIAG